MSKYSKSIMVTLGIVLSLGIITPALAVKTPTQVLENSVNLLLKSKTVEFRGVVEKSVTYDKAWLKKNKEQPSSFTFGSPSSLSYPTSLSSMIYKDSKSKTILSGAWDASEENNFKFKVFIQPTGSSNIFTGSPVSLSGINLMSIGDIYYFFAKIDVFGELPKFGDFDLNTFINKWIEVDKVGILKDFVSSGYLDKINKIQEENTLDVVKQEALRKAFVANKPFNVTRLASAKINGKMADHLKLTFNAKGSKNFMKALSKIVDGKSLTTMELEIIDSALVDLQKNTLELWLDKTTGKPLQLFIKNTKTEKGSKYNPASSSISKITINFTSVGEAVDIVAPVSTLKLEDIIKPAIESAKAKAADAKRLSDLKQIQTALELYFTDYGSYPIATTGITLGSNNYSCLNKAGFTTVGCSVAYMGFIPADPGSNSYIYTSSGSSYLINATLDGSVNGLSGSITASPTGIVD